MKIYANRGNHNEKLLDSVIGLDLWVPVGWKDDFYGWVKILCKNGSHYKANLITQEGGYLAEYHIRDGYNDDWRNYIRDYAFPVTHFEAVDIDQAVTGDELEEEIESRYDADMRRIGWG